MAIELLSIGTELVIGQIQDTNAHWIAKQVFQIGGELRRVTMLRDERDEMSETLNAAIERDTSLILTTGGLGPTPDDMTVAVVAALTGREIVVSAETVADFRRRRNMSADEPLNYALTKMAMMPEGATVLQNPQGWAPCVQVEHKNSTIMLMPGPPREMKAVFETHIQPLIAERYRAAITTSRVRVNMFEAELSPLLQKVMERYPDTYLKAYVGLRDEKTNMMPVDLVSRSADTADAEKQLKGASDYLEKLVKRAGKRFKREK